MWIPRVERIPPTPRPAKKPSCTVTPTTPETSRRRRPTLTSLKNSTSGTRRRRPGTAPRSVQKKPIWKSRPQRRPPEKTPAARRKPLPLRWSAPVKRPTMRITRNTSTRKRFWTRLSPLLRSAAGRPTSGRAESLPKTPPRICAAPTSQTGLPSGSFRRSWRQKDFPAGR